MLRLARLLLLGSAITLVSCHSHQQIKASWQRASAATRKAVAGSPGYDLEVEESEQELVWTWREPPHWKVGFLYPGCSFDRYWRVELVGTNDGCQLSVRALEPSLFLGFVPDIGTSEWAERLFVRAVLDDLAAECPGGR